MCARLDNIGMSKIGKQNIKIPTGITVTIEEGKIYLKGQSGELTVTVLKGVKPAIENDVLIFSLSGDNKQARSNWGTLRSLVANAISGLAKGFEKILILEGIGYRITKEGNDLSLNLGFSHPVKYKAPAGIIFEVPDTTTLKIKGIDKALVGQVAAEIRNLKKPEPYKGKGFRYADEIIRRKAGKKVAAASGT